MDTEPNRLLLKEEVFEIVGAAMEVLNGLGHGLHEKPYENALVVEFNLRKIQLQQQLRFDVYFKEVKVGEFVPDLIAFDAVVVDVKASPAYYRRKNMKWVRLIWSSQFQYQDHNTKDR